MKFINIQFYLFVLSLFIANVANAQDSNINFVDKKVSWDSVLTMAKDSNKIIFLDAYTVWCGPCKKMDKVVFVQDTVATFYNNSFINVKMDMEKGIGRQLAKKYNIRAYPTFLYLDTLGELLHRDVGYKIANDFIELGRAALDTTRQTLSMDKRFENGNTDSDFLYDYTKYRYGIMDKSHLNVVPKYLATQEDWLTDKNLNYIFQYTTDTDIESFKFIIENKKAFEEKFGEKKVIKNIQTIVHNKLYAQQGHLSLEEIDRVFKLAFPDRAGKLSANFRMGYYRQLGDRKSYAQAAMDYLNNYPTNDYWELNDISWTFYEVIEDPVLLEQAVLWAKKSIKMRKRYANYDTLASLYYKLGKKRKAKCTAKRAIRIAKKEGDDYRQTSLLMEKIKEMKK